jgi:hypothetical protein
MTVDHEDTAASYFWLALFYWLKHRLFLDAHRENEGFLVTFILMCRRCLFFIGASQVVSRGQLGALLPCVPWIGVASS